MKRQLITPENIEYFISAFISENREIFGEKCSETEIPFSTNYLSEKNGDVPAAFAFVKCKRKNEVNEYTFHVSLGHFGFVKTKGSAVEGRNVIGLPTDCTEFFVRYLAREFQQEYIERIQSIARREGQGYFNFSWYPLIAPVREGYGKKLVSVEDAYTNVLTVARDEISKIDCQTLHNVG